MTPRSTRLLRVVLGLALVALEGCAVFEAPEPPVPPRVASDHAVAAERTTPAIDAAALSAAIRQVFSADSADTDAVLWRVRLRKELRAWYSERDFSARWTAEGIDAPATRDALSLLENAEDYGLPPARYHVQRLREIVETSRMKASGTSGDLPAYPALLAECDVLLSDGLTTFATDVRDGMTNPRAAYLEDFFLSIRPRRPADPSVVLAGSDVPAAIRELMPRDARTLRLRQALRTLRLLAEVQPWAPVPAVEGKLYPGSESPVIPHIRARLQIERVIDAIPVFDAGAFLDLRRMLTLLRPDTSRTVTIGSRLYDPQLAGEVRRFQERHGLLPDSVLGARTVAAMNVSVEQRIRQIELNLERFRWITYPDSGRYVLVNIPEFYLYAVEQGEVKHRIKVCVGEKYRGWSVRGHAPRNYQTPIISGELSFLVLNPVWSVPASIATRETYYQALKDPTYLIRNNYRVYRNDSIVNPTAVNWREYNPSKLPFRFVQGAGESNALGRIKFSFHNPFDVYLHDTPKRLPFKSASRAVSHGCVRVEEPHALLSFLLEGHPSWDYGRVLKYLAETRAGKAVFLDRKVPIHIDYVTAWVDDDGILQFRDDVYGKDAQLRRAMAEALRPPVPPRAAPATAMAPDAPSPGPPAAGHGTSATPASAAPGPR